MNRKPSGVFYSRIGYRFGNFKEINMILNPGYCWCLLETTLLSCIAF